VSPDWATTEEESTAVPVPEVFVVWFPQLTKSVLATRSEQIMGREKFFMGKNKKIKICRA